eukprot:jgi/Undpi1/7796/HiC_scaffold_23.g10269.m1
MAALAWEISTLEGTTGMLDNLKSYGKELIRTEAWGRRGGAEGERHALGGADGGWVRGGGGHALGGAEGGRGGYALREAEGGTGEGRSAESCQEQEGAQRTTWGVGDGGSAGRRRGGERGGGRGQGCRRVEGGSPGGRSGTDPEEGLEWVSSRGEATPSSSALAGRQAGTLAGSSGRGHPAPHFFNRHQSATYGTDRFGRYFAPLQTLGDVTNTSSPGGEAARCLGSRRGMAPTGTKGAFDAGSHQPENFAQARRNGQVLHSNVGELASTTSYVQPSPWSP